MCCYLSACSCSFLSACTGPCLERKKRHKLKVVRAPKFGSAKPHLPGTPDGNLFTSHWNCVASLGRFFHLQAELQACIQLKQATPRERNVHHSSCAWVATQCMMSFPETSGPKTQLKAQVRAMRALLREVAQPMARVQHFWQTMVPRLCSPTPE